MRFDLLAVRPDVQALLAFAALIAVLDTCETETEMQMNGNSPNPHHYDTPLFVVWNEGDIVKIVQYLTQNRRFNDIEWVTDRHNNPLCRVGIRTNGDGPARKAERVCTIVCRKAHMKAIVNDELNTRMHRG